MKRLIAALVLLAVVAMTGVSDSQTSEYKTVILSGTDDILVDSTLTAAVMRNKRIHINGIYAFFDNGANTNQFNVQIVRGTSALREANVRRVFRYAEAMTSGGYKAFAWPLDVTGGADSTIYFVINAASSDSLYLTINYRLIND